MTDHINLEPRMIANKPKPQNVFIDQ